MTEPGLAPGMKLDLSAIDIVIVNPDRMQSAVLAKIMNGFGAESIHSCTGADQALGILDKVDTGLVLIEGGLADGAAYDLVANIRRSNKEHVREMPILVLDGTVRERHLEKARDSGANFVITKPIVPDKLFDRLVWLTMDMRKFVVTETYIGPDRRFKMAGLPVGVEPRRETDLTGDLGAATDANMDQGDIDALFG